MPFQTIVREYMIGKNVETELPKCHPKLPKLPKHPDNTSSLSLVCEALTICPQDRSVTFKPDNALNFTVDEKNEFLAMLERAIIQEVFRKVEDRNADVNEEERQPLLSPRKPSSPGFFTSPRSCQLQLQPYVFDKIIVHLHVKNPGEFDRICDQQHLTKPSGIQQKTGSGCVVS